MTENEYQSKSQIEKVSDYLPPLIEPKLDDK